MRFPVCSLLVLHFACLIGVFGQDSPSGCPSISVTGPAGIIQRGEKFVFIGRTDGDVPKNVLFQWEVSGGKIVEGQGTLKISANAEWRLGGATITATLTVLGLPDGCPKSASETAGVTFHSTPILIDEFGRLAKDAIRTRLNKFFAELANNPNNQGYIILYGTAREFEARERLIVQSVNFRNFDRSRITIVRGGTHESGRVYTKLYRIPPGADNPAP